MGFLSFIEKRTGKIATKRVQKIATDTARVMINVVKNSGAMFDVMDMLKPHDFARMSIYGRPRWSRGDKDNLLFDGLETRISFTEGTNLADVVSYVSKTEFAADPNMQNMLNPEHYISLAENVAREYVETHAPEFL